jgi:hypothetical protein
MGDNRTGTKRRLSVVKDPTPIPPARPMEKRITFFGQPAKVACDGRCSKAWGINSRPSVQLSDDEDDYYYVPDGELPDAPADPGTTEGFQAKPLVVRSADDMNKWCVRECERCAMSEPGAVDKPLALRDFSQRRYKKPQGKTP